MTSESELERGVFAVSDRALRWADVVCAAQAWGEWSECARAAHEGQAALARARSSGVALSGGEFDAEQERFRRSRRLLAADELVSWLTGWGIDVPAWRDYIRSVVLRRRWGPERTSSPADLRRGSDPGPLAEIAAGAARVLLAHGLLEG